MIIFVNNTIDKTDFNRIVQFDIIFLYYLCKYQVSFIVFIVCLPLEIALFYRYNISFLNSLTHLKQSYREKNHFLRKYFT